MKRMKKLFALLMTLAMVMGLGITAMAEENDANARIVISNEGAAALSYVQLVEADRDNPDGWSIIAGADIFEGHQIDVGDLGDIAKSAENGDAENGTLTTSNELASLLEDLKSLETTGVTGNSFTVTSAGLYLVVPVKDGYTYSPTLVYVPVNASGDINVKAKGESDTITKIVADKDQSVQADDVINYTVTRKYPYISANYSNPTFTIEDTLTNATFNEDSVVVTGAGELGTGYRFDVSGNTLTITINYDSAKAGNDITITYSATVSDNVNNADNPVKNKVVSNTNGTKTGYEVVSDPVKTTIYKVDAEDETKLAGAKFNLYKGLVNEYEEGVSVPVQRDIVVGLNGEVTIYGLDAQEQYYLVETEAPQGYSVDKTPIQLRRPSDWQKPTVSTTTDTDTDGVKVITTTYTFNDFGDSGITQVANTKLSALPETGGMGTTLFTIAGCVIMISAAGLFFATRKKSN